LIYLHPTDIKQLADIAVAIFCSKI